MDAELVVLSHLRWTWVWQRPQHVVSRLARSRRTWFVEYPVPVAPGSRGGLRTEDLGGGVTRVLWQVPTSDGHVEWDDPRAAGFAPAVAELLGAPTARRTAWLYTPLALPVAEAVSPDLVAYDVMDDLSSFAQAPRSLVDAHAAALARAGLVLAGGRTLGAGVRAKGRPDVHVVPSGVDPEHYRPARELRRERPPGRPVVGYVGVVDERLDLPLLGALAEALPDWSVHLVGPVAKVPRRDLPAAPNVVWWGQQDYRDLPALMAGFDVALMPFALNEATRSISPTKTLEYLAAGLPVVSTPVADVVADVGPHVHLARTGEQAAGACRTALARSATPSDAAVERLLRDRSWDAIGARLDALLAAAEPAPSAVAL